MTLCCAVSPFLSFQHHTLQILIEQSNSGSLANGANYHPPNCYASMKCGLAPCVWALCASENGSEVHHLHLSSVPSVPCVHQGKPVPLRALGSVSATVGHGWFVSRRHTGLCACSVAGAQGVCPRDLLPLGCCEELRGQDPGCDHRGSWDPCHGISSEVPCVPWAAVSWWGVNLLGDRTPLG